MALLHTRGLRVKIPILGETGIGIHISGLLPPKGLEQIDVSRKFPTTTSLSAQRRPRHPTGVIDPCSVPTPSSRIAAPSTPWLSSVWFAASDHEHPTLTIHSCCTVCTEDAAERLPRCSLKPGPRGNRRRHGDSTVQRCASAPARAQPCRMCFFHPSRLPLH